MKNTVIILVSALALVACSADNGDTRETQSIQNICTSDTVQERSAFILQCIGNGNPKSDEEPEDWIGKCETFAENLWCPKTSVKIVQTAYNCDGISCWWRDSNVQPIYSK